jgi:hemoglobin
MNPSLCDAATSASVCPAADRDTPQIKLRSSAASIAATIGVAVQPVTPAKQILIMTRPYGLDMQTVYDAAGGADGLLRLAHAWHARVMADEVVSHAFSHGFHPEHSQRLAAYWGESLGGPTTFTECYGDQTSVVRMHSGNGLHEEMDQRAIVCFDQALADIALADSRVGRVLHDYFAWATTTVMSHYHRSADDVPDGLRIPQWSWHGLVSA